MNVDARTLAALTMDFLHLPNELDVVVLWTRHSGRCDDPGLLPDCYLLAGLPRLLC